LTRQEHQGRPRDGKASASKYRGVSWSKSSNKWAARIYYDGKEHSFGCFGDEEEAARAYDNAARAHHGNKATLNFPADAEGEEQVFQQQLDQMRVDAEQHAQRRQLQVQLMIQLQTCSEESIKSSYQQAPSFCANQQELAAWELRRRMVFQFFSSDMWKMRDQVIPLLLLRTCIDDDVTCDMYVT
jgi:hypothetical protein